MLSCGVFISFYCVQLYDFSTNMAIFHSLPEPNRAWLLVVYVFTPSHLLC